MIYWSIADVAELSRVSSRTLRHYDQVGLLAPHHVGSNGYRYYAAAQLLRLQQILVLRELGLGLAAIGRILDGQDESAAVLRRHHRWLLDERERFDRLATTVMITIAQLKREAVMQPDQWFEEFTVHSEKQAGYEAELIDRYGDDARENIAMSKQRTSGWTDADYRRLRQDFERIHLRLVELIDIGVAPNDVRVLEVMEAHYEIICRSWTPDREAYKGLGVSLQRRPGLQGSVPQDPSGTGGLPA